MTRVAGFMVVRRPEYAKAVLHDPKNVIGQTIYRGIDRLAWEDLDEAYYNGTLTDDLLATWKTLRSPGDLSGLRLSKDYVAASRVWERWNERSEIIAVWSPELEELKGSIAYEKELTYLGLDCFCLGEWSVLLHGVYRKPDEFGWVLERLNEHGLLDAESDCSAVFSRYLELSANEIVEPLMQGATIINVRVFAVEAPRAA
jgi:hypothetical protein